MVAHEVGPLARQVKCRSLPKRLRDWAGVAAREREVHGLHPDEVELHIEPVAVRAAEERQLVLVGRVHLAEQDGVAEAAGDKVANIAEVFVGVKHALISRRGVLGEQERNGIHTEARDSEFKPEAQRA